MDALQQLSQLTKLRTKSHPTHPMIESAPPPHSPASAYSANYIGTSKHGAIAALDIIIITPPAQASQWCTQA
jgi:hypothetical protein